MKHKRKYNRTGKYSKHTQDNVQSITEPIREQSSDNLQDGLLVRGDIKDFLAVLPETAIDHLVKESECTEELHKVIPEGDYPRIYTNKKVTFKDLPPYIQKAVESVLTYRKNLSLPDDSVERKERAVKYWQSKL